MNANLDVLTRAKAGMSPDEERAFDSYLIGAVSHWVTPERWRAALNDAFRLLERERKAGAA